MASSSTIVAAATPQGESALAMIRASGPLCSTWAHDLGGGIPPPRLARHISYRNIAGEELDDLIMVFFAGPASYTGEDSLELTCHGNPLIVARIIEDLCARGGCPAEPGEFTRRAFMSGRLDLLQAEAVMDLIQARGSRALAAARRQLRGHHGSRFTRLRSLLLEAAAGMEAYIDFPGEDLPPEDQNRHLRSIQIVDTEVVSLLATARYGEFLREGIRVLLLGPPNAGKSSLLNCLLGWERALVSPEPGTTRDFIEGSFPLGGHHIQITDTAGLRPDGSPLERAGQSRTLALLREADIVLYLNSCDGCSCLLPEDTGFDFSPSNTLWVESKCDLPGSSPSPPAGFRLCRVSARTGEGLETLRRELLAMVEAHCPEVEREGLAINQRHAHALGEVARALGRARVKLEAGEFLELAASDVREAAHWLGEILGRIDSEDMLDVLFARFCIGK